MPIVRAALERGQRVRMTVTGGSMAPFIHDGDIVDLDPISTPPQLGDVVLARCHETGHVLHRIVKIQGGMFFLRGDAQPLWDGPVTRHDVLGKVATSCRNGQIRTLDRGAWRVAGLLWMYFDSLRHWLIS